MPSSPIEKGPISPCRAVTVPDIFAFVALKPSIETFPFASTTNLSLMIVFPKKLIWSASKSSLLPFSLAVNLIPADFFFAPEASYQSEKRVSEPSSPATERMNPTFLNPRRFPSSSHTALCTRSEVPASDDTTALNLPCIVSSDFPFPDAIALSRVFSVFSLPAIACTVFPTSCLIAEIGFVVYCCTGFQCVILKGSPFFFATIARNTSLLYSTVASL